MPATPIRVLSVSCSILAAGMLSAQALGWAPRPSYVPGGKPWLPSAMALLATDVARGVIVSFGAYDQGATIADTWEWGGTVWTPRSSTPVPPARVRAQLVHDPLRRRTVLFGGSDPGGVTLRGDQWEWDGTAWTQRLFPVMPSPREGHAMVFDEARGRIVLHGGRVGIAGGSTDTWEYDGTSWVLLAPSNSPGWRTEHQMVYDAARQRVVTFGGYPIIQNETWEWDGTTWTQMATAAAPPARLGPVMLYDAIRQRTVLAGGLLAASGTGATDTWEWDGVQWQQLAAALPFPSTGLAAATDAGTGLAQVFHAGAVWRWNGLAWASVQAVSFPPAAADHMTACTDTLRNRVVAFAGGVATASPATYEWDGLTWSRSPATGPINPAAGACAFDSGRARTVLVSPESGSMKTWEWNGVAWTPRLISAPSLRGHHGLAYDAARLRCVLFGGDFFPPMSGPVYFGDTWTYDGVQWVQQMVPGPAPRAGHAMAYDPVRQRVVLFGGSTVGTMHDDTWEWNGSAWTQIAAAVRPPGRFGAAMAYDAARAAVVLFGGAGASSVMFADTWTWNGVVWTPIATSRAPSPRYLHAMAVDPLTQQVMVHGGMVPGSATLLERDDTWVFGAPVAATSTSFGTACATGLPPGIATSTPYLGNSDFAFEILDAPPAAPCVLVLSTAATSVPIGPCTLYVQLSGASALAFTNPYGVARVPLPLPFAGALRGFTITAQAGVLTSPGAWSGIDMTAARTIVLGD